MKIGVVNYRAGNLTSIESALAFLKADYFISSDPEKLFHADRLIFPGVGESRYAMGELKKTGNDEMIKKFIETGKALLGICLGAQILFSHSQENDTSLLSVLQGEVVQFDFQTKLKIPHMGWNSVEVILKEKNTGKLFTDIPQNSSFYFVHSYYINPLDEKVICGICDYGIPFCAAVESNNIFAVQFHPEKSGRVGLKMLQNFLTLKD